MASISKIGRYYYVAYYDANGRKRKVKGFTDRRETESLARKLEDEKTGIRRGTVDPDAERRRVQRARPWQDHRDDYRRHLEAGGRRADYITPAIRDVTLAMEHAGVRYADDYTREHLDAWVLALLAAGDDSARTVNRRIGSVQSFLKHLRAKGAVSDYRLFKYPRQRTVGKARRTYRPLTSDEMQKLLTTTPEPRRTVYRFAALTGLRRGEIVRLTPAWFSAVNRTLTIPPKNRHQDKPHTVPLSDAAAAILADACRGKADDAHVFHLPDAQHAARQLRDDCKAAGVPTRGVVFHSLRHTFCTLLARSQVHPKIAQELMRHATLEMTLGFYTHFGTADARKAANLVAF